MRESVAERFADMTPSFDEPSPWIVRIPATAGAPGDVLVGNELDGLIVLVGHMTHGHFNDGDAEEIVQDCCDFLEDLFSDRVVVYRSARHSDGWFYPESPAGRWARPDAEMVTWSGPWSDLTS